MLTDYREIAQPAYFGRGSVHVGPPLLRDGSVNAPGWPARVPGMALQMPPGRPLGNARRLDVTPKLTSLNVSAWDSRGSVTVDGVTLALDLYGHGGANLAIALGGPHTQTAGAPREDIVHVSRAALPAGSMIFARHLIDTNLPVTCEPSWTTWAEGVHWRRTPHGPLILAGARGPDGASIRLAYTSAGGSEDIAGAYRIGEMSLIYIGINRYGHTPVQFECYRASVASVDAMPLISESTGVISLTINLMPVRFGGHDIRWYRRMDGAHIAGAHA